MSLITRQGKGSKLTIQEMDNNLRYLNGNLISKDVIDSYLIDNDTEIYKGFLYETYDEPTKTVTLKYNINQTDFEDIIGEFGYSYLLTGNVAYNYEGVYDNRQINLRLVSNLDYVLGDKTFVIGNGFNNIVRSIVLQSDGKILVGGNFSSYNGVSSNTIIRLNSDGSVDETFDIGFGFNNTVFSIVLQSDGKILVGGAFDSYNGETANRIIRLNANGSVDETFDIGIGSNGSVRSIILQSDAKILVGGAFDSYNGETANRIIRLNTNGSRDETFDIGNGFNGSVQSIALQSDGKILVGGVFTSYNGETSNTIIRLNANGSVDETFDIGFGFNGNVFSIVLQSDGKILFGGAFDSYNGETANRIIRLNANGSVDETFDIGNGFNGIVFSIVLQSDGKILVGGEFSSYNGETSNRIIRLNANGSVDETFDIGSGFNSNVFSIVLQSDGKILVGGGFTSYNGETSNRIIRLNSDGSNDTLGEVKFLSNTNLPNANLSVDEENSSLNLILPFEVDRVLLDFRLIKAYGSYTDSNGQSS
jgi:uncharacterized delta-60 repeat protein